MRMSRVCYLEPGWGKSVQCCSETLAIHGPAAENQPVISQLLPAAKTFLKLREMESEQHKSHCYTCF